MKFKLYPPNAQPYYIYTFECEPVPGFRIVVQPTITGEANLTSVLFEGLDAMGLDVKEVEVEDFSEQEVELYTLHREFGRMP